MKIFKNLALMTLLVLTMASCVEKEPAYGNFGGKDVDFTYNVDGDEYTLDFYVVSTIKFNNTSEKSGNVTWDFGDGTTSTDQNPTHKYAQAGLYQVTLTVDGVGKRTYPLLIYDIAPVLSVAEQSAETVVINDVTVLLDIALPNPENLECKYVWKFPEGTALEDGTPIEEFTGYSHSDGTVDNPGKLKFKNIGSQKIELQTWFDVNGENRRLEDSYVNVQVGSSIPCPTLYYAVFGGNIKAYKLVDMSQLPAGTKNMPFDMGVNSGNMPTTLVFASVEDKDYVYILDCGKQYYYVNDENGVLGDGKISVMTADGTDVSTMVTNVGGQAFNDPFQGLSDGTNLYYTDRNTGIRRLPLTTRGEREQTVFSSTAGYFVVNNMLQYYGNGIAYGAIHTGIYLDRTGVFWWGKNYSGNGIYRFRTSDIGEASATKPGPIPFPIVLQATQPRAFTLDEDLGNLYVWMCKGGTPGPGFTAYPMPSPDQGLNYDQYTAFIAMEANPENTTADEGVYTTQFAVDALTHYVYFGFRAASTEKNYTTGLKYYNPVDKKVYDFNANRERILGLCINPRLTNLF
ncbi:MAG: PKD domain-containing protein [Muribaculaceae bacterium]|nr:PKD domain-containing protein [Muribaculaceae bacterium]MBR5118448.1 PKD domain-containing protein [Muribaculaceae bacterium]